MSDLDREEILAYFNAFDSKKNGVLEFSEFAELIKSFGVDFTEDELKEGFNKIDTGNNSSINFEEFLVWWGEHH